MPQINRTLVAKNAMYRYVAQEDSRDLALKIVKHAQSIQRIVGKQNGEECEITIVVKVTGRFTIDGG